MSLVSYLPPFPPPVHTSQLTETWQWPTCMCWQPKLTLLFWSHLLGLGKVLPPTSFPLLKSSWDPVLPCASGTGSTTTWDARASPSALCSSWLQVQCSSWPSSPPHSGCSDGSPRAGQWHHSWAIAEVISHQLPNWIPFSLPQHTCRLATVAFCDSALFCRSRCRCV